VDSVNNKVGIGTESPDQKLDVSGRGRFLNNGSTLQLVGIDHTYLEYYPDGTGAGRKAWSGFGGATNDNFTIHNDAGSGHIILSGGNVGVGTSSPDQKLHIEDSANPRILIENTDGTLSLNQDIGSVIFKQNDSTGTTGTGIIGKIRMSSVPTNVGGNFYGTSANMIFSVGNNANDNANIDAVTIQNDGNVGIGTNNPQGALHVAGDSGSSNISKVLGVHMGVYSSSYAHIEIVSSGSNAGWIDFKNANTGGNGDHSERIRGGSGHLEFITNMSERMRIDSSGNVGIGTNNPDTKLHVNGAASATHISLGTTEYPTLGGNWLTIFSPTYDGSIGDNHPDPDGGILFTNRSSGKTFPWGYYMGVVKDVASTNGTTQRFDIGKSSDLNSQNSSGGADTLTPYFTIDNGNVGIGTVSPDSIFHTQSSAGANNAWVDQWKHVFDANWNFRLSQQHNIGSSVPYSFKQRYNSTEYTPITFRGSSMEFSGNVGIGTTSPNGNLHIMSDLANASSQINPSAQLVLHSSLAGLDDDGDIGASLVFTQRWLDSSPNSHGTMGSIHGFKDLSAGNYGGGLLFKTQPGSDTAPVERMRIDRDGNVAIGLTGAESKLHIYGSDNPLMLQSQRSPYPKLSYDFSGSNAENFQFYDHHGSGRGFLYGRKYTTGTTLNSNAGWHFYGNDTTLALRIDGSANVGVGTSTFTDTRNTGGLHLPNSKGISFAADSTQSNSRHWRIRTDDYSSWGSLQFSVSDNNSTHPDASDEHVMTMTRDRYVGIGTASPNRKLHVNGDTQLGGQIIADNRLYAYNGVHVMGDWLRIQGGNGVYWESYGGGWYMQDTTWVRVYNGKYLWVASGVLGSSYRIGAGTSGPKSAMDVYQGNSISFGGSTQQLGDSPGLTLSSSGGKWGFFLNSNNDLILVGKSGNTGNYYGVAGYVLKGNRDNLMNFTGQHRSFVKDIPFTQIENKEGLIVSADQNEYIKMSGGAEAGSNAITINESLPIVSLSRIANDKKCFGVISTSEDPDSREERHGNWVSVSEKEDGDTRIFINSVGEGAIWVTNINGPLESGDYITTSSVVGYGMKQDSEFLANYTVAKITMDCDFNPETKPVRQIIKRRENVNYWITTKYVDIADEEEYLTLPEDGRRTIEKPEDGSTVYQRIERYESKKEEEGGILEVREELVNVLDEHGQLQWEDHPTETEKAYKVRYVSNDGQILDEETATAAKSWRRREGDAVHIAAFVGCTYHCG
jgi:hypothetical protein